MAYVTITGEIRHIQGFVSVDWYRNCSMKEIAGFIVLYWSS